MNLNHLRRLSGLLLVALCALVLTGCDSKPKQAGKARLRIGHFPNITHAQGVIASQLSREKKGWFEERLGPEVEIEWFTYNAGPSAIEAIFAGSIDLTYIGPSPVLNGYTKTGGDEVRVVSGAANGGGALVVKAEGGPTQPKEFRGKKVATPQLGNTQDVACRVWLRKQGFKVTQLGGDVQVIPTENPNQLPLFQGGSIDAVWTVEPWVSRLETEAGGKIFLEQKDEFTTVLAASTAVLKKQPALVKKFVAAHRELTEWITAHPDEAKALVRAGIKEITKRDLPPALIDHAWPRLTFTSKITREQFEQAASEAQSVQVLQNVPKLDRLVAIPE
jgi:NitT/TauT family transport system substrate-binding protein